MRMPFLSYILLFILLCAMADLPAYAKEDTAENITENSMLQELELGNIDQQLEELFPNNTIQFSQLVSDIMQGKVKFNLDLIIRIIKYGITGNIGELKKIGISILLIGIIASLFSNFSKIFENHQIADISFYFLYMLLMLILLLTFKNTMEVAMETIENAVVFLKLLIPTFFTIVGLTSASMTAMVFYQFMFVIIVVVESILSAVLIPATSGCVFLSLINGLGDEERLTPLIELIHKGIQGSLKLIMGCIGGIGFFQSMITPVIDGVKTAAIQKTISAIPGIGNVADSVTEVVLGSTILIKNSVGLAFVILLLGICIVPIIQIASVSIMIKISAAFIGIVTDKRMTASANQVGDGTMLLLRIVATAIALFVITIAIVISATNRGL